MCLCMCTTCEPLQDRMHPGDFTVLVRACTAIWICIPAEQEDSNMVMSTQWYAKNNVSNIFIYSYITGQPSDHATPSLWCGPSVWGGAGECGLDAGCCCWNLLRGLDGSRMRGCPGCLRPRNTAFANGHGRPQKAYWGILEVWLAISPHLWGIRRPNCWGVLCSLVWATSHPDPLATPSPMAQLV